MLLQIFGRYVPVGSVKKLTDIRGGGKKKKKKKKKRKKREKGAYVLILDIDELVSLGVPTLYMLYIYVWI